MKVLRILITVFAVSFALFPAQAQSDNYRQKVLQKGKPGRTYVFGKWTEEGGTETRLQLLGQVKTRRGQIFKIVNSTWLWGQSCHATSRILIFNEKNQYAGNYFLSMTYDLPTRLTNGKLIFTNTGKDCDRKLVTVINLKQGLPKQFFRKCRGPYGDVYSFSP